METKIIKNFSFEVPVTDGKEITGYTQYYSDAEVDYTVDEHYGEDADGNRGVSRYFIEDVRIINVRDDNENDVEITPLISQTLNDEIIDRFDPSKGE